MSSVDSVDLDGGGADAGSGPEQMSVSDTESDLSHHGDGMEMEAEVEQDLPETPYVARAEGEMGTVCLVYNFFLLDDLFLFRRENKWKNLRKNINR